MFEIGRHNKSATRVAINMDGGLPALSGT